MTRYTGITILATILLLSGWGCKKDNPHPELATNRFTIRIVTAPGNEKIESKETEGEKMPITEVMDKLGIHVTTDIRDKEIVTSLNNVLSTASKSWNLYVNSQQQVFAHLNDISVSPSDIVEWRYEPTNLATN